VARRAGAFDAHEAGLAAGTNHSVGLDHAVVLLVDPALGTNVGAGQQLFQVGGKVAVFCQPSLDFFRRLKRNERLPDSDGAMVERSIVGERFIWNVGDQDAVVTDAQPRLRLDRADDDAIESPLFKDAQHLVFAAFDGNQQHALLAFGEHDFISGHAGFALRNEIELDIEANATARAHLACGACEAGRTHVLNADDSAGLHGFKASFEEELLHEGVAHLHVGALGLRAFTEFFAGHGGAVDAVAAGFCTYIYDRVACAAGLAIKNLIDANHCPGRRR